MPSARTHRAFSAPAEKIWGVLADWKQVGDWFPGIASCEVEGDVRTLTLENGAKIVERVTTVDQGLRRLEYEVTGGDVKVDAHRATMDVIDVGGTTVVVSSVHVEPESRLKIFARTLEPALDGLGRVLERKS